ncbi:hypothetical protein BvCmsNSNP027_02205 [Escherichia coli]|nr:hypothetical protein BvCmsNSNP027_02205 [Escherichia coli]
MIASETSFRDFTRQLPFHQGDDILTLPVRIATRTGTLYSTGLKLCLVTAETLTDKTPGFRYQLIHSQGIQPLLFALSVFPFHAAAACRSHCLL